MIEKMFDMNKDWSISFAGCGFMGIYYVGAASCILERFPRLIGDSSKIYGASAGALIAVGLTTGSPIERTCRDLMSMAREARKRKLGPLHPSFNLLQIVKDSLVNLPEDAHLRASGKLCVSLTRVSDGKNVLVSEFNTREELIQALICSCFVPFYCGIIPPMYRGVRYVDGAISDNLPHCHLKNTVTLSAFAGENDICPRASTLTFHEVRFNNVSIQVNAENLYRVTSTFFPPEPEVMAEICHSGYKDALRFLKVNVDLIDGTAHAVMMPFALIKDDVSAGLQLVCPKPACCTHEAEPNETAETRHRTDPQNGLHPPREEHWWLDQKLIENLPVAIKQALCEACRSRPAGAGLLAQMTGFFPVRVAAYLIPCLLPVTSACLLAQRLVDWIPDVSRDMRWLYGMAGEMYKKAWEDEDYMSDLPMRRSVSLPAGLNLCSQSEEDFYEPLTPEATPNHSSTFTWDTNSYMGHMPLTPPPTPTHDKFDAVPLSFPTPHQDRRGRSLGKATGLRENNGCDHAQPETTPNLHL